MIKVRTANEETCTGIRCLSCKSEKDTRRIEISLIGKNATVITLCDNCITSLYIDVAKLRFDEKWVSSVE